MGVRTSAMAPEALAAVEEDSHACEKEEPHCDDFFEQR